jgi:Zn-dependent protease
MDFLILLPVLLISVVLHEVAHAWVARREGDDTAERAGRITLNPISHLDPVGSFLVPLVLANLPGGFVFGWARPVPVNRAKIRTGAWGDIRVSLAGIAVNLVLAMAFTVLLVPLVRLDGPGAAGVWRILASMAYFGVTINLILAVFNLIPVPPLDGSHVVYQMLPHGLREPYQRLGGVGALALLLVLYLFPGGFGLIMGPVNFLTDLLFSLVGLSGRV